MSSAKNIMTSERWIQRAARRTLSAVMVSIGVLHLVRPEPFVQIMPPYLPYHRELVLMSGVCEIAGGLGLLIPRLRTTAAWGLMALFVAVFPANIHMAVNNMPIGGNQYQLLLWLRLPFQALFIAWAWWCRTDTPVRPMA